MAGQRVVIVPVPKRKVPQRVFKSFNPKYKVLGKVARVPRA